MLNQLVIVGRLVKDPTIEVNEEKEVAEITVAVPRSYKNTNGEYETDFIPCKLWGGIANNVVEYCKKGDLLGVKGHVETVEGSMVVIAEKITFLSSSKTSSEEE